MKTKSMLDFERQIVEATGDPSIVEAMDRHRAATVLTTMLADMRNDKGLHMRELAKRMGVSASKVCRMEDGRDEDLNFGDIVKYASALGMEMTVTFDSPSVPAAARIKRRVIEIHGLLEELCAMAREVGEEDADGISAKIKGFYGEVLFNFLLKFGDSYSKLPTPAPLQFTAASVAERRQKPAAEALTPA